MSQGGTNPTDRYANLLFGKKFAENGMKMKEFGLKWCASLVQGYTRKIARYNLEPYTIRPTAKINKYKPTRSKQSGTRKEK